MQQPDICIAGAGIIGLSLALELHARGCRVIVLDRSSPLAESSTAAAGMLAANDPDNPPQLHPLAKLSLLLYPAFLDRLHALSNLRVPFQTHTTLQALPPHIPSAQNILTAQQLSQLLPALTPGDHRFLLFDEQSLDPRELAAALLAAVRATAIDLRPCTTVISVLAHPNAVEVHTSTGTFHSARFVDCTGAWAATTSSLPITPKKGQMLAVVLPSSLSLDIVVRTPKIYIVPRTSGPRAGRAVIGATLEDAGFDRTVRHEDIAYLRALAADLLPVLTNETDAPELESWSGLRPATPDNLPIIGALASHPNHFLATGHLRNGILLAPATAHVMAQLLSDETPSIDLTPFSPSRFFSHPPRP